MFQDVTSPHPGCGVSVATATVGRRFAAFDPGERQAEPLRPHRNLSARTRVSQSERTERDFRAPRAEAAAGRETAMKFRAKIVDLACLNHFTRELAGLRGASGECGCSPVRGRAGWRAQLGPGGWEGGPEGEG